MSWARFGEDCISEVYIYEDVLGGITCCICGLDKDGNTFNCATEDEMFEHIRKHIAAGHRIPMRLLNKLGGAK